MARPRQRAFLVSTVAIRRELRKAAKKLKRLEKKAPPAKRRAINLELAVLKGCYDKLGNIAWL